MDRKCAIEDLFNAVKTNHEQNAFDALVKAKEEHALLINNESINETGQKPLTLIGDILRYVSNGKFRDAKKIYADAEKGFRVHLKRYLEKEKMMVLEGKFGQQQKGISGRQRSRDNNDQSQQTPDNTKQTSGRRETQPPEHEIREPGHHYDSRRSEQAKNENIPAIENSEKARSSKFSDEFSKTVRSKRASIKMRQNNPDIADLSDTNRPTRIAERFSELYDNEWTEAFEELSRRSRSEKETIEYLLSIVQEAYKFCANEAERQIKDITKVFDRILEFGSNDYNNKELISQSNVRSEEGHRLIVQYRKEMAGLAVERFKQVFMESKKHKWNRNIRLPAHLGALDLYGKKAVELTWWMSVQDPPVYLCPASESETDGFDKSLYRAYTKSGTEVDFFVWPALKLYKEGGVLMKGVVQFK